jgi:hypothetical protein
MKTKENLDLARQIAATLATANLPSMTTHMDAVREVLEFLGVELGPAAGSVFAADEWQFTGVRIESKHPANHAREIKVWRYSQPPQFETKEVGQHVVPVVAGSLAPRVTVPQALRTEVTPQLQQLVNWVHHRAFQAGRESVRTAIQSALS